jgi:hypothetical protein
MNYFFGVNNNIFKSEVQIPLFQNRSRKPENLKLFKCFPKNKKWIIEQINNRKVNDYFCILKNLDVQNNEMYFLAENKDLEKFDGTKLKNFNNFTETSPDFRANLKIFLGESEENGFSSYQSEYPFSMISKKGTILTPVNSIANKEADKNYILIRNIFENPIDETFNAYLVNIKRKKIEEKYELKTNFTNMIELKNELIKPEIFLTTDSYLGVPIFISVKNQFISFEHTHPLHEYILSADKFVKISELKKEINEIVN